MNTLTLQVESSSVLEQLKEMLKAFQGVKVIESNNLHTAETEGAEEVPNSITLSAMKEAKSGKDAGRVCMDNLDSFIASMQ